LRSASPRIADVRNELHSHDYQMGSERSSVPSLGAMVDAQTATGLGGALLFVGS
jgi:hypothetical protein